MVRSMTAFAGSERCIGNLIINCELRSVNHRYCDITLKLPDQLRFIETDVRTVIAAQLKRGKVECIVGYDRQSVTQDYAVNIEALKRLLAVTAEIEQHMDNPQTFSALDVLVLPGIQQQTEIDKTLLQTAILELVEQTLNSLLSTREREGAQLGIMIESRCTQIALLVSEAEKRLPKVLQQLREKLTGRIADLVEEPDFDRLEQELVVVAQKLDVAEELDRLKTHVEEVLRVLQQHEPIGRRLDFLMQEMNREANTLGSKSADKYMTRIAIDLKVLIEQMREQIQNIE